MEYHQALVPGLLHLHRRFARDGQRLFLPGAYGLPVAVVADPGATHETTKGLFGEDPDDDDKCSGWKIKRRIVIRLPSFPHEEDQNPSCVAPGCRSTSG